MSKKSNSHHLKNGQTNLDVKKLTFMAYDNCEESRRLVYQEFVNQAGSVLHYIKKVSAPFRTGKGDEKVATQHLNKLFRCGKTPVSLNKLTEKTEYQGITLKFRAPADSKLSPTRAVMDIPLFRDQIYSSPWAAKAFTPISPKGYKELTGHSLRSDNKAFLGINFFRKSKEVLNNISYTVLSMMISLDPTKKKTLETQRAKIESEGGQFVAEYAKSLSNLRKFNTEKGEVDADVLALNYRWEKNSNSFPNKYLIDEIVEIADGFYLGKLFYATANLLNSYNPNRDDKYVDFGFFLIMDKRWDNLKDELYPELKNRTNDNSTFKTFTFADNLTSYLKPECDKFQNIVDNKKDYSILHYLYDFSQKNMLKDNTIEKSLLALQQLFDCGAPPKKANLLQPLHGDAVLFNNAELSKVVSDQNFNLAWVITRAISNWAGKTFKEITPKKLGDLFIGQAGTQHYSNPDFKDLYKELYIGSNIYFPAEKDPVTLAMKTYITKLKPDGKMKYNVMYQREPGSRIADYDESFYFVAIRDVPRELVNSKTRNPTRKVIKFNYRWPEFNTIDPDNRCLDQIVEIADGLFLGQLTYAEEKVPNWTPEHEKDARYHLYGYFILMDDKWKKIMDFINPVDGEKWEKIADSSTRPF